ncbi:hypothetical protein QGN23_06655 [Chryseobacterium gotjawalense]|uniref:TonB C-terminal domain-containing protein n=1 Tax=Chryseobacterium gotjawalense TaxID=3042315 RepID=A0ABY8RHX4_9FLAO|nr:hypothetical protein [Chryseobacterium sp. wdc7]WHF52953.1 hypothetical protein QGN23_06655 [Chryseobacterium sp. wdc7]
MKNTIRLIGILGIMITTGLTYHIQAQETNLIKEVKITANDGFTELRNLVAQNFNFTNPNLTEGMMNSEVKFEVTDNGKIANVSVKGDCKYVNQEIQEVMSHLLYQFHDSSKMNKVYILPISVAIASR